MRLFVHLLRRLLGLVLLPAMNVSASFRRRLERGAPRWLVLPLTGRLSDLPQHHGPSFFGLIRRERPLVLLEVQAVLNQAADDPTLTGIFCRLGDLEAGWATLWELRQALETFRKSGKRVVFYLEKASNRSYWLASCADEVLMAPQGSLSLLGLRAEVTFFRRLFDQVGVSPDFLRVGQYKSMAEAFTESEMTPAMQESLSAVIDDLSGLLLEGIAEGRGLSEDEVRALIDRAPFTAGEALEAGLIDATLYADELKEHLREEGRETRLVPFAAYARRLARRRWLARPLRPRPQVAIVSMEGNIVDDGGRGFSSASSIAPKWYARLLNALREDPRVAGVVLRVNSPGGSAQASDLLWRAVARLQEAKPVIVSMGDTAASGGYYLAAPAGKILATPGTLTGSIGVVAGKFSLGDLYERLGIRKMAIERGRHSGMHTESRPFLESERERLQQEIDSFYQVFTDKVREGRRLDQEKVAAAAQGRVWSGLRGREIGLVDAFGGVREAVIQLKEQLELREAVEVFAVAPPQGPRWGRMLAAAPLPSTLKELVNSVAAWSDMAGGEARLLTVMPFGVDVR